MNRLLFITLLLIFFSSCLKHHATIKIITPANGRLFTAGQQIEVKADLYDPDALESELLIITSGANNADTALNFVDHVFTGDASVYHLSQSIICDSQKLYKILIIANGYSSVAKDSVNVHSN